MLSFDWLIAWIDKLARFIDWLIDLIDWFDRFIDCFDWFIDWLTLGLHTEFFSDWKSTSSHRNSTIISFPTIGVNFLFFCRQRSSNVTRRSSKKSDSRATAPSRRGRAQSDTDNQVWSHWKNWIDQFVRVQMFQELFHDFCPGPGVNPSKPSDAVRLRPHRRSNPPSPPWLHRFPRRGAWYVPAAQQSSHRWRVCRRAVWLPLVHGAQIAQSPLKTTATWSASSTPVAEAFKKPLPVDHREPHGKRQKTGHEIPLVFSFSTWSIVMIVLCHFQWWIEILNWNLRAMAISKWIFLHSNKWPFLIWNLIWEYEDWKKIQKFQVSRACSSPLWFLWVTGSRYWDQPQEKIRLLYPIGLLRPVYLWNSRNGSKHSGSNIPNSKLYVYDSSFSPRWPPFNVSNSLYSRFSHISPFTWLDSNSSVSFSNVIAVIRTGVRNTTSAQPVLWLSNGMRYLKYREISVMPHRFFLDSIDRLIVWLNVRLIDWLIEQLTTLMLQAQTTMTHPCKNFVQHVHFTRYSRSIGISF